MTTEAIQTYAIMQERVAIFADTEMSRLTHAAAKYLVRGATFSGQPTGKNNTIHLSDGSGFVPAEAVAPCYRYSVRELTRILQAARLDAQQAEGGTAFKRPGEQFDAAVDIPGWLWITTGVGYIPQTAAQIVGVAQPSYPGGAPLAAGLRTYVVQGDDVLSTIAAKFYNGDQSRWEELYNIPANKLTIGPNPHQIQPGMVLVIP
jgi:nucleoid-associated protein YgaU